MRTLFFILLFFFPVVALAQNTNYNAIASGRVRLEGRSIFAPSFEIFVDSFTTLEQGSYGGNNAVFNSLTHYWPMTEGAGSARADTKGSLNLSEVDGTIPNAAGIHGNAANFGASNSRRLQTANFVLDGPFSICFWIKPNSSAVNQWIFTKQDTADNQSVDCGYLSAGPVLTATIGVSGGDAMNEAMAVGSWHLVSITTDNVGNGNLYVDSVKLAGGPFVSAFPSDLLLSLGFEGATVGVDALIGPFMIFGSELTQGNVNTLWNSGTGTFYDPSTPDLMTLTYLTNSTISVGQFGWAYLPVSGGNTTFKRTYVGSNTFALPKATIAMGTAQYTTAGTRSASYDSNTNAVNEVAEFILPGGSGGNKTVVSFGMMIQFCATNSSATLVTNRFVTLNGPPYGSLQQEVSATIDEVRAYATDNGGLVAVGGAIPIVPCKLYWLTGVRNVTDGHANFSLYDPVNGAFIGESVAVMGTTNVTWNIQIGPQTAELATSGNTYWDNLIVNYHDGFYPLGPLKTTPPAPVQNVVQRRIFGQGGEEILGQGGETILGQ